MTVTPARTLAQRLLAGGVPPSLLIDLLDPEGARLALASELLEIEVARTPVPALRPSASDVTRSA